MLFIPNANACAIILRSYLALVGIASLEYSEAIIVVFSIKLDNTADR